jgi:hypothetical protein
MESTRVHTHTHTHTHTHNCRGTHIIQIDLDICNYRKFKPDHVSAHSVQSTVSDVFLFRKGKVVPLHAMKALWVRGGIAPTVS